MIQDKINSELDHLNRLVDTEHQQNIIKAIRSQVNESTCVKCSHRMHSMCMELNVDLHTDLNVDTYEFGCNKFK